MSHHIFATNQWERSLQLHHRVVHRLVMIVQDSMDQLVGLDGLVLDRITDAKVIAVAAAAEVVGVAEAVVGVESGK